IDVAVLQGRSLRSIDSIHYENNQYSNKFYLSRMSVPILHLDCKVGMNASQGFTRVAQDPVVRTEIYA
ncbi:MAG: hypothetical protein D6680_20455, partial [Cyanobacteria bacterium J007]